MAIPKDSHEAEHLHRLGRKFLVHAFLYYKLGESVIDDEAFDALAKELSGLYTTHPDLVLPHQEILAPALGAEASGFAIRTYPNDIITDAFKLLFATRRPTMDFHEFVERQGYTVQA